MEYRVPAAGNIIFIIFVSLCANFKDYCRREKNTARGLAYETRQKYRK